MEEDTFKGGFGQQALIILIAIGARKSGKGSYLMYTFVCYAINVMDLR